MSNKFSSDGMPSYVKATGTVLEIIKMAGYFSNRPHTRVPRALSAMEKLPERETEV
jgi:hypothetical protein